MQIKEHHDLGSSTVLLLLGNKTDLEDDIEVPEEEARQFAVSIGAFFACTSAKVCFSPSSSLCRLLYKHARVLWLLLLDVALG